MRVFLAGVLLTGFASTAAAQPAARPSLRQAILTAEDARAASDAAMAPLFEGLASRDTAIVLQAIRALGRFERPALISKVLPFLDNPSVEVRIAAAFALGQIGQDSSAAALLEPVLAGRLSKEPDPGALGSAARSLARLHLTSRDLARNAQAALVTIAARPLAVEATLDVARALESFLRAGGALVEPHADFVDRLRRYAVFTDARLAQAAAVRRAAAAGLIRVAKPDSTLVARLARDPDAEVRRLAVLWLADTTSLPTRRRLLGAALTDRAQLVRLEAVRVYARHFQTSDCRPLVAALGDSATAVVLEAIDHLATPCPADAHVEARLGALIDSSTGHQIGSLVGWHRGAHALVALARLAPNQARGAVGRAAAAEPWQMRMYAARAAALVGDLDQLLALAADPSDNVREAAVAGLARTRGHGADSVYRAELGRPDYQLILGAATALAGSPDRAAAVASLMEALGRLTAQRMDTSRDPRLALLERLGELADPAKPPDLESLLADFDPEIANRAAALLTRWTGRTVAAAPRPLESPPVDQVMVDRLRGAILRITMAKSSGGGSFEIALYPDLAPATVARVVSHSRAGYYNGLTFHRVVSNFVIQGGSPRANEFAGDTVYLRDEVGPLSHERGTLGISTRGRDTGDSQIFVNLVENLRLDFNYTVWGRVVNGMGVVDGVLEGDVIERVAVVDGRLPKRQR